MNKLINLSFVFPGQGSQSLGMLSDLAANHREIQETFEAASTVLGKDLWKMSQEGPAELLNQTINTQPLMLTAGVATWRVWSKLTDIRPSWMAGHSLGEYSALVCANSIVFEDAVKIVSERARFMQEAVPDGVGAMAAILGLENHLVVAACKEAAGDEVVSAVNFNAPGQVVIAGHAAAVARAIDVAKEKGARKAILLPVSVPSHCSLMKPAAERLDELLQTIEIKTPEIAILHNADVNCHEAPEVIRNALKSQLFNPVRWTETVRFISDQGSNTFVECGPGKVLSGMNKRIVKGVTVLPLIDETTLNKILEALQ
ncbi:MAG: [acyl-carrier-protein] S-malonyltransferase [Gammaproteobacteria bacterium]|nr:MAG: [acyl-carrier-protein] S-malonyltransferase [Gammaproteobacteria bacterium]